MSQPSTERIITSPSNDTLDQQNRLEQIHERILLAACDFMGKFKPASPTVLEDDKRNIVRRVINRAIDEDLNLIAKRPEYLETDEQLQIKRQENIDNFVEHNLKNPYFTGGINLVRLFAFGLRTYLGPTSAFPANPTENVAVGTLKITAFELRKHLSADPRGLVLFDMACHTLTKECKEGVPADQRKIEGVYFGNNVFRMFVYHETDGFLPELAKLQKGEKPEMASYFLQQVGSLMYKMAISSQN